MSSYVIVFAAAAVLSILTGVIWYRKRSLVESAVIGGIWFFCSHILACFALFLFDEYSLFRAICLTLLLDAAVLGAVISARKTKPFSVKGLFCCDMSLRPVIIPLCICLFALPFTLQKNEFFGMGQDQGVYQTQAILFLNGDNERQKNLEEYDTLDTAEERENFSMYVSHKLGGYDIPPADYPETVYDRTVGEASGIIHGIPTHAAILAMWGELFGVEHMADVETIFYLCLIFLVYCICRNLRLKPISCVTASVCTALAPIVIWVSKASLTEMFLAVLIALFLYIMTDRANRNERWLSILPVAVFGCFHVSFYTMVPLFLMIYGGLYFFTRQKQFAVLMPVTAAGYVLSYLGMRHIQPVYTMNNYRQVFVAGINVHNITTVVIAAGLMAVFASLLFILGVSRTNKKFYIMQNWNSRAGKSRGFRIFLILLLAVPLLYILLKSFMKYGTWEEASHLTLLGFFGNAGLVLVPAALIAAMLRPKLYARNNARLVVFLMFFYCILVYSAFLRFDIQYYYYYARYLAPFVPAAAVFAALTLDRFSKKLLIPAAALGLAFVLPYDLFLLYSKDDSRLEWEVLMDTADAAEDADCIVIDKDHMQCLWLPLDAMTDAAVFPEEEDLAAQLAELSESYETVLYVTNDEIPEEDFKIVYRDVSWHSEDDLNHTGRLIPFSYQFWQTEDMVLIGCYEGNS